MNHVDFNKLPKTFINQAVLGQCKDAIMFVMFSGELAHGFMTTPGQFKLLVDSFKNQMDMYEAEYGPVDVSKAKIPSMFQLDNFKTPPETGGNGL